MVIFKKPMLSSLVFLLLFVAPHTIYSIIPKNAINIYLLTILVCYIACGFFFFKDLFNLRFLKPLKFALSFLIFGTIGLLVHQSSNTFNLLAPLIAYLGFVFLDKMPIRLRIFDIFIVFLYIYFYNVYYSVIPDLFFRPGFDEDAVVFDNASSNAIAISLNITLYAYIVLNRFIKESNQKKIVLFALINFILIVIQQSRAGILISLVILILALIEYKKEWTAQILFVFIGSVGFLIIIYFIEINNYIELIGNINGIPALIESNRGEAQSVFFKNMDIYTVIFGHSEMTYAYETGGDLTYTFNMFLDMWNKYGLFQLLVFLFVLLVRFIHRKKFEFPIYYFLPFILYSFVESIFFPNFWDVLIYVLLFTPKTRRDPYKNISYFYKEQILPNHSLTSYKHT